MFADNVLDLLCYQPMTANSKSLISLISVLYRWCELLMSCKFIEK